MNGRCPKYLFKIICVLGAFALAPQVRADFAFPDLRAVPENRDGAGADSSAEHLWQDEVLPIIRLQPTRLLHAAESPGTGAGGTSSHSSNGSPGCQLGWFERPEWVWPQVVTWLARLQTHWPSPAFPSRLFRPPRVAI